jgi:hypothetical protein
MEKQSSSTTKGADLPLSCHVFENGRPTVTHPSIVGNVSSSPLLFYPLFASSTYRLVVRSVAIVNSLHVAIGSHAVEDQSRSNTME